MNDPAIQQLASRAQGYLRETLGIESSALRPWSGREVLPYFVLDAFEFRQLNLLGEPVLLAFALRRGQISIADLRARLDVITVACKRPVLYVTDSLASYERKRLIEQKVPFIVPGNQLYLPHLGIDLREYFRRASDPVPTLLSPSAQALLIAALLRPQWEAEWNPAEAATALGYTPMTASRAARELIGADLAQARKTGRTQHLLMPRSARATWEHAAPVLRSPVQRVAWSASLRPMQDVRLAGLSALARETMLAEPTAPTYAVTRDQWQRLKKAGKAWIEAHPGACQLQIWGYSPALLPGRETVDPLSLAVSLRDDPDERVQAAVEQLLLRLPW